jgi:ribA/ribD-fused uncharacterized protein
MKKIEDRVTDTHVYFWGDPTLSNWGPAEFNHKGLKFHNSEQAFMYEKALYFSDKEIAQKILENDNPRTAKDLGRKVKNFDIESWSGASYDYMIDVCYAKFKQNKDLGEILLSTGNKTIVEGSPYDKIWGVGLHWASEEILDEANWEGLNWLGDALMEVRRMLKHDEAV